MGKRIPKSTRHKKLKFVDPCYSGHRRLPKKKLLPNEPPTEVDYQEVPRQMEELINRKNEAKNKRYKKKKKKKKVVKDDFIVVKSDLVESSESHNMPNKSPKVFKQKRTENERQFFNRLQQAADMAIAEAKVEAKYNIKLVNIDKQGNAEYVTPAREVSERKRKKRNQYKEKEKEKKKMKTEDKESDLKKERIQFGEVVTAPPNFTAKPRKAPATNKPGKKNLVLKDVLSTKSESGGSKMPTTVKLKKLVPEKRKVLENERARAVQFYRMMKNKKSDS